MSLPDPACPAGAHGARIGSVDSLNAVPLTRGIESQVLYAAPSRLAQLLRAGRLDAALVSSSELLTSPDYTALDGIGIASHGPVRSVLLAHRQPLAGLREVACDPASLTSVNLLRILLGERGIQPAFRTLGSYDEAPACDAVLLIGDRALDFSLARHPHQLWDLGAAWEQLTGLPFVYAVWTLAPGADVPGVAARLRGARDRGLRELADLIAGRSDYPPAFCHEYFTRAIGFVIGDAEKRGLLRFGELLHRHTGRRVFPPRWVSG